MRYSEISTEGPENESINYLQGPVTVPAAISTGLPILRRFIDNFFFLHLE